MDPRSRLAQWPRPEWQQWHGWTVRTHAGVEVGAVVGRFDGGPHDGQLRVRREVQGGTAVFAVPLGAIATVDCGALRLRPVADPSEWLVYLVRRHLSRESA